MIKQYKDETHALQTFLEQKQCLTSAKETIVINWILQLESWNFPPLVFRVKELREKVLKKRKNFKLLAINWPQKFLIRHPEITYQWSQFFEQN